MYLHPLPPPPTPVDFSASLIPTSTSTISTAHLGRATQAREALRGVLSNARTAAASSFSSNGAVSAGTFEVKLVSAVVDYLPHLVAIYNATQIDELIWRAPAWFAWPALLSPSSPNAGKLNIGTASVSSLAKHGPFASSSLRFELDNVLILYSLALSNLALLQSVAVGNYEQSKILMESQRKEHEAVLKRGLTHGKKAVEVIQWMLNDLDAGEGSQTDGRQDWNQEWQASKRRLLEGLQVLHQLPPTLISLRLLLSPATCSINSAQLELPPLPKGHPSPSLLAKLYLEVPRLAEEARVILQSASGISDGTRPGRKFFGLGEGGGNSSGSFNDPSKLASKLKRFGIGKSRKDQEAVHAHRSVSPQDDAPSTTTNHRPRPAIHETGSFGNSSPSTTHSTYPSPSVVPVTSRLLSYLDSVSALYRSIALKYLALSVGESGEDGQGGKHAEAVVFLRMAKDELEKLSDGPNSQLELFIGKGESKGMRARLGKKDLPSDQLEHPEAAEQKRTSSTHPLAPRLQSYHAILYSSHLNSVHHILNLYKKLNDSVSFQVMPSMADLYTKIPTPRGLLTFDQGGAASGGGGGWSPPRAAFGSERTREGEEQGFLIGTRGSGETQGDYAGRGAYY